MTKLTAPQLELLTLTRARMLEEIEGGGLTNVYLCHNIFLAEKGWDDFPEYFMFGKVIKQETGLISSKLCRLIEESIEGYVSMEFYLDQLYIGLNWSRIATCYAEWARLAWLDRIIETGEIV
jgi:hypothetical protein